jgi:regulatory protein
MKPSPARRALPPLDEAALNELALRYVGRFATTRAKLRSYLARKVCERGWNGARVPDLAGIADRFSEQGYIDDRVYALTKAQSLTGRGYGKRRVAQALRAAGIEEDDGTAAHDHAEEEALLAAMRFARRRRIGPFATHASHDPKEREKAIAAMIRAGHSFDLARKILALKPGETPNSD